MRFDVGASFVVVCANLYYCIRLGFLLFVSVSFFVPHFVVTAWCLKCTEHVGTNSASVQ